MRYPIVIEPGTESTAFGVVVPDLPGCFSAGDTVDEAFANAEAAIELWVEAALDAGERVPSPSAIEHVREAHAEYASWTWGLVSIDPAVLDDTIERVNVSLPHRVLYRLDELAKASGETRSGYIAKLAMTATD